ncbi:hypothetical protein NCCP2222_06430 [Sporosarcina sp. NCCP-2222]|nr:hypothetical protein NCCP2222_06430 [Sporosarcina sp. NCCP-2222]
MAKPKNNAKNKKAAKMESCRINTNNAMVPMIGDKHPKRINQLDSVERMEFTRFSNKLVSLYDTERLHD